jgi:hypothetical protein
MIDEKENKNEELEVNLEEVETEKEVNVPLNPLEKLQQMQEEPSKEDKTFENEREIKLEEKKHQLIQMTCLILLKFVKESKKK